MPLGLFVVLAVAFSWLWYQASTRHSRSLAREGGLLVEQTALRLAEIGKTAEEVAHHMRTAWRGGGATLVGFGKGAQELVARNKDLLAINWVSPGGVLEYVYPPHQANQDTLGWNLSEDPDAGPSLEIARRCEEVVFTPPLLGAHESACVGTYLQLGHEGSDGFVNIIFSLDALVDNFGSSVLDRFDYALVCQPNGGDGQTSWFGAGGIGDNSLSDRPLKQVWPFMFSPNRWELVLAPKIDRLSSGTSVEEDLFLGAGLLLAAALALLLRREFRSRAALAISERRFRTIFSSISDAVLIHDPNGALREVNARASQLFGLPEEVLERLDMGSLLAEDTPKAIESLRSCFEAARTTGEPQLFEFEARRGRDGRWWAEVSLRAAHIGGRERLLAVVRDVTERRQAQEALRAARNRLDHLLSTGPTTIYSRTPGPTPRLTFVSRNAEQLIGVTQEELIADYGRWRSAVFEGDRQRVDAEQAESDKRGNRFLCEYRLTTGHGEEIWIQDAARLLRDNEGHPVEWVGCWREVTARKQSEQSQRLMMDELDHRVKNTLAMVLSLLEQTLIGTNSSEDLRAAFQGRVEALASAHEALAMGQWEEVDLERITRLVLGPHVELGRISVVGPEQPLDARTASPLALSLHELATNAVKHGALSVAEGHVDMTWVREERGLVVSWQERGGPETEPPTERSGGGTGLKLVRGLIEHELGGRVLLDFDAQGLVAEIVLPLGDTATRPRLLI